MISHYCPACWHEIAGTEEHCPDCGFDLAQDQALNFEEKLLRSLDTSYRRNATLPSRSWASWAAGQPCPVWAKLLDTEVNHIYALREALVALSMIRGSRSRELLQQATVHPYLLVRHLAETLLKANAMFEKTTIILVRHGQTEWNRIERYRGRVDVPLNDTGLAQAEATGRRVAAQWQPTAIYSSPLSRAVEDSRSHRPSF